MRLLIVIATATAVSLGVFASAQNAPRTVVYGPSTQVTAERLTHDPSTNTTQARGNVRIAYQNSVITADEADLHHLKDSPAAVDFSIEPRLFEFSV